MIDYAKDPKFWDRIENAYHLARVGEGPIEVDFYDLCDLTEDVGGNDVSAVCDVARHFRSQQLWAVTAEGGHFALLSGSERFGSELGRVVKVTSFGETLRFTAVEAKA